jgi:protein involved in polysaccharide export with SLBB domain
MIYSHSEMNRVFGMSTKFLFAGLVCLCVMACEPQTPPQPTPSQPAAVAQYLIAGGVTNPGPRALAPGDTVATVIARNLTLSSGQPMTIVLIRRAPEGKTHQLIQLDAQGQLMDEKQNFALRDGDELVFPGGKGADPTGSPTGNPQRGPE